MSADLFSTRHQSATSWRMVRLPWQQVVGQGRASRSKHIPFDACPYTLEPNRTFWQRGWKGETVTQREAAELQQKADAK
jgi:ribosome modulation factor